MGELTSFQLGRREWGGGPADGGGRARAPAGRWPGRGRGPGWGGRAGPRAGGGPREGRRAPAGRGRGWGGGPARPRRPHSRRPPAAWSSPAQGPGAGRSGRSPPTPTGVAAGQLLDLGHIGPGVVIGEQGPVQVAAGAVVD